MNANLPEKLDELCERLIVKARKELFRLIRDWKDLNDKRPYSEYSAYSEYAIFRKLAINTGDSLDDLLSSVDLQARELLRETNNFTFVKNMMDFVAKVFDAFDDLSVVHFRSVDDYYKYEISDEMKDIKLFWTELYNNHPELKKIKDKYEEEKNRKKDLYKKFYNEMEKELKNEMVFFEKEIKEIFDEKNANKLEQEKSFNEDKIRLLEKLEKEKEDIVSELNSTIDKLKYENNKIEQELNSLSALKFIQKDKLKYEMDINKQNMFKCEEQIGLAISDYEKELANISRVFDEKLSTLKKELDYKYIMPINPNDVCERVNSLFFCISNSIDLEKDRFKSINDEDMEVLKRIYNTLIGCMYPVKSSDLPELDNVLRKCSNQKINSLLSKLIGADMIFSKTFGFKTYFSLNDNFDKIDVVRSNGKINLELNNSFYNDRKKLYEIICEQKNGVDINNLFEHNKLKNNSKLRSWQLLFSLLDDEIIKLKVNNGEILFEINK